MTKYLLDTNTVSYILRNASQKLNDKSDELLSLSCISSLSEAELRYGLAKNPSARIARSVETYLAVISILPWDSKAAKAYADLKIRLQTLGLALSTVDMLIAAHSIAVQAVLVTSDKAFWQMPHLLKLEDWLS